MTGPITFQDTEIGYKQFTDTITRLLEMDRPIRDEKRTFDGYSIGGILPEFGAKAFDDAACERLFGIPQAIARLYDEIHDHLPAKEKSTFFVAFRDAIQPDQDLNQVWGHFGLWILVDEDNPYRLNQYRIEDEVNNVARLYHDWLGNKSVTSDDSYSAYEAVYGVFEAAKAGSSLSLAARAAANMATAVGGRTAFTVGDAVTSTAQLAAFVEADVSFWQLAGETLITLISNAPIIV